MNTNYDRYKLQTPGEAMKSDEEVQQEENDKEEMTDRRYDEYVDKEI